MRRANPNLADVIIEEISNPNKLFFTWRNLDAFNDEEIKSIADNLQKATHLQWLKISYSNLSKDQIVILTSAIKKNPSIKTFRLHTDESYVLPIQFQFLDVITGGSNINDIGLGLNSSNSLNEIAPYFKENTSITNISLNLNESYDANEHLKLKENQPIIPTKNNAGAFNKYDAFYLALKNNKKMMEFTLCNCILTPEHLDAMKIHFQFTSLTSLAFYKCLVFNLDLTPLANLLLGNINIKKFVLHASAFLNKNAPNQDSRWLESNKNPWMQLESKEIEKIINVIPKLKKLTDLTLEVLADGSSLKSLADLYSTNDIYIEKLLLRIHQLNSNDIASIITIITKNKGNLKELDISFHEISEEYSFKENIAQLIHTVSNPNVCKLHRLSFNDFKNGNVCRDIAHRLLIENLNFSEVSFSIRENMLPDELTATTLVIDYSSYLEILKKENAMKRYYLQRQAFVEAIIVLCAAFYSPNENVFQKLSTDVFLLLLCKIGENTPSKSDIQIKECAELVMSNFAKRRELLNTSSSKQKEAGQEHENISEQGQPESTPLLSQSPSNQNIAVNGWWSRTNTSDLVIFKTKTESSNATNANPIEENPTETNPTRPCFNSCQII